jgi:hypothetical protein
VFVESPDFTAESALAQFRAAVSEDVFAKRMPRLLQIPKTGINTQRKCLLAIRFIFTILSVLRLFSFDRPFGRAGERY